MVRAPNHSLFYSTGLHSFVVRDLTHHSWRSKGRSSIPCDTLLQILIHQIEIFCEAVPKTAEVLPPDSTY